MGKAGKARYIDNLEKNMLVAFNHEGKTKSGKVLEIEGSTVKLEEFSGQLMYIEKKDIIWVKTGKRWPKGVYGAIRGDY